MAVLSLQFRQQLSSPQPTHLAYQFCQNSNSKNTLLQCHSLATSDDDASSRLHSNNNYAALRALTRTYRLGLVFLFPGLLHFLLFTILIVPLTMAPLQQLEPQARNHPTLQIQEEKNKKNGSVNNPKNRIQQSSATWRLCHISSQRQQSKVHKEPKKTPREESSLYSIAQRRIDTCIQSPCTNFFA